MPDFKTRQEAADICRCCLRVIDNAIRSGDLPAYDVGGVKINLPDLLTWLAGRKRRGSRRRQRDKMKFREVGT